MLVELTFRGAPAGTVQQKHLNHYWHLVSEKLKLLQQKQLSNSNDWNAYKSANKICSLTILLFDLTTNKLQNRNPQINKQILVRVSEMVV